MGEWEVAQAYVSRLTEHTAQHSMSMHAAVGRAFQGQLAVERGDPTAGLEALLEVSYVLQASRFEIFRAYFAEPLGRALAAVGRLDEAIVAIDLALKSNEAGGTSFMLPELLRAKGDILAAYFPDQSEDAEALLHLSFEQAGRQGALAWQLRAAMSLARAHASSREPAHETRLLLRNTYRQFAEGFGTRDLIIARRVLEASTPN
jgi:predicted ATPase